jgi:hypothetical protein
LLQRINCDLSCCGASIGPCEKSIGTSPFDERAKAARSMLKNAGRLFREQVDVSRPQLTISFITQGSAFSVVTWTIIAQVNLNLLSPWRYPGRD